jgi:3-hydroxybutyryl-CoA dehydrogenase
MTIERIGVIGAGTMGSGIAALLVMHGYSVDLYDPEPSALERARARVAKRTAADPATADRLGLHEQLADAVVTADLVIEAAPEILDLKRELFAEIDGAARSGAILATNTSQLSVTYIAAATARPADVVGMHWFNPPERMQLIELVRGVRSSAAALAAARGVAERCGKTVVTVEDRQGFVATRVVAAVLLEGARIFEEGVASRDDIDTAVKLGLNHPMGPLELADYIGLDTVLFIADSMAAAYGDRFTTPQTLRKLVEAGRLGRKTGAGYYDERG